MLDKGVHLRLLSSSGKEALDVQPHILFWIILYFLRNILPLYDVKE